MRRKSVSFTGREVLRRHSLDHMIVFGEAPALARGFSQQGFVVILSTV
jgi:hypothetical protein